MSGDEGRGDEGKQNQAGSFPTLGERRYSRTLEGGLAILGCFTPQRPVLGTTEIAEMLGMSVATAHRLIRTFAEEGYLEQADSSRSYRLTLRATELGMASINETGLCRHARPHLEVLATHVGHTVALGVLDGSEVLLIDLVAGARSSQNRASEAPRAGSSLPVHRTAIGKALLAGLPRRQRLKLISELDLQTPPTPHAISSVAALGEAIEDVRREGLAIADEELEPGTRAVAAPVRDQSGDVVAAVSVVAHNGKIELEELLGRSASRLLACTWRISRSLGWVEEGE